MKTKSDIIQKAVELIRLNAAVKVDGCWRIIGKDLELSYLVERDCCTCPDWVYRNIQPSEARHICKHQWAVYAAPVALFIVEIRAAENLDQLFAAVRGYQEQIKLALPQYAAIANREYEAALQRLQNEPEQTAEPQQPKPARKQKYERKSVNRAGEQISMISQKAEPQFYNGYQIT